MVSFLHIKTSTIDSKPPKKDKYQFNSLNKVFKIINKWQIAKQTCQICCDKFYTKNLPTPSRVHALVNQKFPKSSVISLTHASLSFSIRNYQFYIQTLVNFLNNKGKSIKSFKFSKLLTSCDIESNPNPSFWTTGSM